MIASTFATPLPAPIAAYIDRFIARRRMQRLLSAAARAGVFTIIYVLAWCLADRIAPLAAMTRMTALAIHLVVVLLILARPLAALLRQADANAAAAEIERREPRLAQRLRTVTSRLGDTDHGSSRELLEALTRQVADDLGGRDPVKLLSWRPVLRPLAACLAWLALATALSFSTWLNLPALAVRYFAPLRPTPPVTTTRLLVTPGDAAVPEGEPLRVQASALRLGRDGVLRLHVRAVADRSDPRAWHVEPMTAGPGGRFEAQIARVGRELEYFVSGGDARSEMHRVSVLPRPAVRRFLIRYAYPPHTGLSPRTVENQTGVIEAPVGSEVRLEIETTQPLRYAIMTVGAESIRIAPGERSPVAAKAPPPTVSSTTFIVQDDRRYTLRMVSDRGVSGIFRGGTIRAVPDRPPVANVGGGAAQEEVGGGDVLPVRYQVADDYGIARLDVEVRVIRRSGAEANASLPVPLPVPQPAAAWPREIQGVLPVNLRRFALETGDAVEVRLQAEDRAGQFALSAPTRLRVTSPAPPGGAATQTQAPPPAIPLPPRTEPSPAPPLDWPGYEEAIRAYLDALRGAATRPAS